MMNYGVPYQGSKNRIAKKIIDILPSGKRFVDLFAGGCAMTHCALLSEKYERYLVNDKFPIGTMLFRQAIEGEFNKPEYRRWISREDFFSLKDKEGWVMLCFSFGNKGNTYMCNKDIEPYKRACHYAIVFDQWDNLASLCSETYQAAKEDLNGMPMNDWKEIKQRRLKFGSAFVNEVKRVQVDWDTIKNNPLYNSIKIQNNKPQLESLCRLERLQGLERLDYTKLDYRDYQHEEGDVVYCDPPYCNTGKYHFAEPFDHGAFWEWVRTRDFPVYVSEYNAPEDFIHIWQTEKMKLMGTGNKGKAIENVFVYQKW